MLLGTQAAVPVLALGTHRYPGAPDTALLPGLADVGAIAAAKSVSHLGRFLWQVMAAPRVRKAR